MFDFTQYDLTSLQWGTICLCAVLVGVSKTGVPGLGILAVPLLALGFEALPSTGLLLPMLAVADVFAVVYYHRHANWRLIVKMLPPALGGIAAGSVLIRFFDGVQFEVGIGLIVLGLIGVNIWLGRQDEKKPRIPTHWCFALAIGFLAGVTTQLANAAGPIIFIFLLALRYDKNAFIGTGAWYFLILNWLKIPIFWSEGRIDLESLKLDLLMCPLIIVGAVTGIYIYKRIPQKWFNIIVQALALAAAIKLIF
jgi:hypothetical protein